MERRNKRAGRLSISFRGFFLLKDNHKINIYFLCEIRSKALNSKFDMFMTERRLEQTAISLGEYLFRGES